MQNRSAKHKRSEIKVMTMGVSATRIKTAITFVLHITFRNSEVVVVEGK